MDTVFVEQYANLVGDFSSQYGGDLSFSYTAANCLGRPQKFPSYGDCPQTFVTKDFGPWWKMCPSGQSSNLSPSGAYGCSCDLDDLLANNFIELKFEHEVHAHAVYVFVTYNPGAITSLWAGNGSGRWKRLWSGKAKSLGHHPRIFNPPIAPPDFPINQIRLHLNQTQLPYYTEIDAVALLGTASSPWCEQNGLPLCLDTALGRGPILKEVLRLKLFLNVSVDLGSIDLGALAQEKLLELKTPRRQQQPSCQISNNGPFDRLPREIQYHIFKFLDFYTLVQCCSVSKLFLSIASDPQLYLHIQLKPLFYCACNQTIKFILKRTQLIHLLDLSWCGSYGRIDAHVLRDFVHQRGANLQYLVLQNCHAATSVVLSAIGRTCANLVHLDLSNCHILEHGFSDLRHLTRLRFLNLYRSQISLTDLTAILKANSELVHLNVASCGRVVPMDELCLSLCLYNKRLLSLDLWRSPSLTARGVHFIANGLHQLQELDLGWCQAVNARTGCIINLAQQCRQLQKLFLNAHRQLSDPDLLAMGHHLSQLQLLSIMGNRNVSRQAVKDMALGLSSLQMLDIGYCEQLEGQDFWSELRTILPDCHIIITTSGQD